MGTPYYTDYIEYKRLSEYQASTIKQLKKEVTMWKNAAQSWMKDHDDLKNKYEPEVLLVSDVHLDAPNSQEIAEKFLYGKHE